MTTTTTDAATPDAAMPPTDEPTAAAVEISEMAADWTIRPELPVDLDQVHELHREADGSVDAADRVDAVRSGPDFEPSLTLAAVTADGTVLGHVTVCRATFRPDAGDAAVPALCLAALAVLPAHQSRGIGSALVAELLAEADARAEPLVVVHGPPALFEPFGFRTADELGIRGPWEDADRAFLVRARPGTDAGPGTLELPAALGAD